MREEERTQGAVSLPFPVGVRALLPDDVDRRRAIERTIVDELASKGYREVVLPVLDFADPYAGVAGAASTRASYRLIDREGELLTLRADFTPMVARAVAPRLETLGTPLRIFYRGDVVRCESPRLGSNREYFQVGAELVGDGTEAADVEVVRQAVRAVGAGTPRSTVSVGDARLARLALRDPASSLGRRLLDGTLSLEMLGQHPGCEEIASRLTTIVRDVESTGTRVVVTFDREDAEGYYTGLRFRIYAEGATTPVAKGGRYDELYGCFGADAPAVGFTLNIDALEVDR